MESSGEEIKSEGVRKFFQSGEWAQCPPQLIVKKCCKIMKKEQKGEATKKTFSAVDKK